MKLRIAPRAGRLRTAVRLAAAPLLLAPLLAGCSFVVGDCHKPGTYADAESVPPLRVPAGLDAPDTKSALKVPDLNEPERARGPNEPCLDTPPRYNAPPPRAKPVPQA